MVLLWVSRFVENGSSRGFHLAFLPLVVLRTIETVKIFLVAGFISLPIMLLETGQLTAR